MDVSLHEVDDRSVNPGAASTEASLIFGFQQEFDSYYAAMRHFSDRDVTEIFMAVAAFSARACEIRSNLIRNESRRAAAFRTREIDPFLEACEFQFKVWSRLQSVRQMEVDLSRGGT